MTQDIRKPTKVFTPSTWSLVKRLAGVYMRPYVRQLVIALIFMLVSAAMTASFAKLIEPVLDEVLVNKKAQLIVPPWRWPCSPFS